MSGELSVHEPESVYEPDEEKKLTMGEYLAERPDSTRIARRRLAWLEAASFGVVAAVFVCAILVSINRAGMPGMAIMAAWFALPVSITLVMVFVGLNSAVVGAFPASPFVGRDSVVKTGSDAVANGLGLMVTAPLVAAYWLVLGYAIMKPNVDLAINLIGIPILIGLAVGILSEIQRRLRR